MNLFQTAKSDVGTAVFVLSKAIGTPSRLNEDDADGERRPYGAYRFEKIKQVDTPILVMAA
jgi:hypothetical protein